MGYYFILFVIVANNCLAMPVAVSRPYLHFCPVSPPPPLPPSLFAVDVERYSGSLAYLSQPDATRSVEL